MKLLTGLLLVCMLMSVASGGEPRPISRHTAVFTRPPRGTPNSKVVDGPLLGNGDVGVTLGGAPDRQTLFISKNDFWSRTSRRVITVGRLGLAIPDLAGASYRQEQDLGTAEVRGAFAAKGLEVRTRSWVAATENLSPS